MPPDPVVVPPVFDVSTIVSLLAGVFLPWAIAAIQSSRASEQYRAIFSFVVCLVVGLLTTYLTKAFVGEWGSDLGQNVYLVILNMVTVTAAAWQTYARLWSKLTPFKAVDAGIRGAGNPSR